MTEVSREWYVYVYYDPRNFQPFYIGKGKGKRLTAHGSDPQDTKKTATIRAIRATGLEPTIRVIANRLTEEQAFLVEKTLLWSTRGLTNVASGNFKENFRPDNTLHRPLLGFDFSNHIYYFNACPGPHRLWHENVQYGYVSAGQGKRFRNAICHLHRGDLIVARADGPGYVGLGRVVSEPLPIREFKVPSCAKDRAARGKPLARLGLKANITANLDDDEMCEWAAGIDWLKTTDRKKGHWAPKSGLYAPRGVTCHSLDRQPKTVKFIEHVFDVQLEKLATFRLAAAARG